MSTRWEPEVDGMEPKMITKPLDVVVFDEDGRFAQFMAVWGPANVHTLGA